MLKWLNTKRWRAGIVACVAATTLAVVWWELRPAERWGETPLALHLHEQAVAGTERQALAAIDGLDRLGDAGTPFLVALLDSPQASIATATEFTLLSRVARLRQAQPTDPRAHESARLAAALAKKVPEFSESARSVAARLAVQLLTLAATIPANTSERERLITSCDEVLTVASLPPVASILRFQSAESDGLAGHGDLGVERAAFREMGTIERLARLPGGTLPLVPVPSIVGGAPMPRRTNDNSPIPRRLAVFPELGSSRITSDEHVFRGKWRAPEEQARRPVGSSGDSTARANRTLENSLDSQSVGVASTPDTIDRARAAFRSISLRDLMWSLQDQNPIIAKAAAEELLARGLSAAEVELARRLTSPKVRERKQLVDDLPNIRGINGRLWLFWLAEDENSNVRLAALSMLATTVDPATQQRLVEMASRDRDPRIVRLAERLAQLSDDAAAR